MTERAKLSEEFIVHKWGQIWRGGDSYGHLGKWWDCEGLITLGPVESLVWFGGNWPMILKSGKLACWESVHEMSQQEPLSVIEIIS